MSSSQHSNDTPSEHSLATLLFARLMEQLPDHVYFKDREGRFLCINKAHAEFFGLKNPAEAVGKCDYDFFGESFARQKDADEREIVRTGIGFVGKLERSDSTKAVRWVMSTKLPLFGEDGRIIGTFGISRDVTDTQLAKEALEAQHRLLGTLIEILPCRIFVKDRQGRIQLTNEAYRRALGLSSGMEIVGRRLDELVDDARTETISADEQAIMETGQPILNREQFDASPIGDKRWNLVSRVPLRRADGSVQGIVGMSADITIQKEAEARAVRAQRELEAKNQQIESELHLAREMQTELMSASLQNVKDSLDLAAPFAPSIAFTYEPCAHLAGDFFQAVPLSRQRFGLLICDVMGHGVKAALVTTLMRGLLAELTTHDRKPSHVLSALNERLCGLLDRPSFPRFVTALYVTVDTVEGRLSIANAGHPWPLLVARDGAQKSLGQVECCPALGLIAGSVYESVDVALSKGDRLLLYTDGLKEELNWAGEEFGPERLAASLSRSIGETPAASLQQIVGEVRSFSGSVLSGDDLCAIMTAF